MHDKFMNCRVVTLRRLLWHDACVISSKLVALSPLLRLGLGRYRHSCRYVVGVIITKSMTLVGLRKMCSILYCTFFTRSPELNQGFATFKLPSLWSNARWSCVLIFFSVMPRVRELIFFFKLIWKLYGSSRYGWVVPFYWLVVPGCGTYLLAAP